MNRFFHGSAEQLILGLVDARQVAPDELSAIEARLAARAGAETSLEEPAKLPKSSSRGRKKPSSRQRLITLGALFLTASLGAASLRVATAEPQPEQQPRNVPAAQSRPTAAAPGGAERSMASFTIPRASRSPVPPWSWVSSRPARPTIRS